MSNVVATRFPPEVIAELDEVARERKRTRAEIIREAVQIYLSEWADYAIALERLNDPNDPILGEEEFWTKADKDWEAGQASGSVTDGRD
jgi:RHH-type transcriptional regulator, rel operon repressor / antitoxin RelB